jgi:hypothetical protein
MLFLKTDQKIFKKSTFPIVASLLLTQSARRARPNVINLSPKSYSKGRPVGMQETKILKLITLG